MNYSSSSMHRLRSIFSPLFILLLALDVNAQSKTGAEFFEGKWNVLVKGLPDGDTKMFFVLERKDTIMTGVVQDSTGAEISKLDSVQVGGTSATVYFVAQGYNV